MYRFCFDYDGRLMIDWTVGNMDINSAFDTGNFASSAGSVTDTEGFVQFGGVTNVSYEGIEACLDGRTIIAVTQ